MLSGKEAVVGGLSGEGRAGQEEVGGQNIFGWGLLIFLQPQFGLVLEEGLSLLLHLLSILIIFLRITVIVDKFILNFVMDNLIDKIVLDALLEGHPLLLIMILQDFLVPGKTHFVLVEGSDE